MSCFTVSTVIKRYKESLTATRKPGSGRKTVFGDKNCSSEVGQKHRHLEVNKSSIAGPCQNWSKVLCNSKDRKKEWSTSSSGKRQKNVPRTRKLYDHSTAHFNVLVTKVSSSVERWQRFRRNSWFDRLFIPGAARARRKSPRAIWLIISLIEIPGIRKTTLSASYSSEHSVQYHSHNKFSGVPCGIPILISMGSDMEFLNFVYKYCLLPSNQLLNQSITDFCKP